MKKSILILLLYLIISCTSSDKDDFNNDQSVYENISFKDYELFNFANEYINSSQLELALIELDKIEVIYPTSPYANKSMLLKAYIYFLKKDYEKTRAITEMYKNYYPGSKDLVYANYLEAMTYYVLIKKSEYSQENTFKALKDLGGKSTIYTNIGFQTHRTIPFILNHFKIPFLSEKHVSEYFSKFYTNTLTILSQLGNFGSVTLVEDPNIYLLLDEKECPAGTQTKLLRINFPIYTSYIRRLCKLLNYDYLAPFELVIPDVFGQTSDISSLVGDDFIHSSDIFYEKFANYIYQKTNNKKLAK